MVTIIWLVFMLFIFIFGVVVGEYGQRNAVLDRNEEIANLRKYICSIQEDGHED